MRLLAYFHSFIFTDVIMTIAEKRTRKQCCIRRRKTKAVYCLLERWQTFCELEIWCAAMSGCNPQSLNDRSISRDVLSNAWHKIQQNGEHVLKWSSDIILCIRLFKARKRVGLQIKFCTQVGYVKSQYTDDKSPLKRAWSVTWPTSNFEAPNDICGS